MNCPQADCEGILKEHPTDVRFLKCERCNRLFSKGRALEVKIREADDRRRRQAHVSVPVLDDDEDIEIEDVVDEMQGTRSKARPIEEEDEMALTDNRCLGRQGRGRCTNTAKGGPFCKMHEGQDLEAAKAKSTMDRPEKKASTKVAPAKSNGSGKVQESRTGSLIDLIDEEILSLEQRVEKLKAAREALA